MAGLQNLFQHISTELSKVTRSVNTQGISSQKLFTVMHHVNQFIQRYLDDNDRPNLDDFRKEITEMFWEFFNGEIAFAKIKTIKQFEGENIAVHAER